jgi:hypothetical protein
VSLLALSQGELDNKCLSFFEVTGIPSYVHGDDLSRAVGLTYNLETSVLRWLKADGQTWGQLLLRSGRLATWEPLTPEKIGLIAINLGVISNFHVPVNYPGRFENPEVSAVTISPDGVVFYRETDDKLSISDITRLAGGAHAIIDAGGTSAILDTGEWTHFQLSPRGKITSSGPDRVAVGNGQLPNPTQPSHFGFTSLANCSQQMRTRLEDSGHNPFHPFTAEATAYVVERFGVDPHDIDHTGWTSANTARRSFTVNKTFDLDASITALRMAIASQEAKSRTISPAIAPSTTIPDSGQQVTKPQTPPI